MRREHIQKFYLKPLLEQDKIKKIDGTHLYQLAKDNITKTHLLEQLYSESEIMNTTIFKTWKQNNSAKNEYHKFVTMARLCLGQINSKFKIHPDMITKDNWQNIMPKMVDALLEVEPSPKKEPHWSNRQVLRHLIIYGLDINISKEKGISLRISGDKQKPKNADLHITKEQTQQAKKILLDKKYFVGKHPLWFIKFGVKTWTFVRPSTIYIIKIDDVEFYDRKIEYVEVNGIKNYKTDVIAFSKLLLSVNPNLQESVKINSFIQRTCTMKVFENKTQDDFRKFIYDEDFVIPLEKYYNERKFQKKKYLFWENNDTDFTFENYDTIIKWKVQQDNSFYKKILAEIGFKREDFGSYFRANYGFRHFGLQMWLIATDYNYDKVSEM